MKRRKSYIQIFLNFIMSVFIIGSLISYNPSDPSFNVITENVSKNLFGTLGSHFADFMYQSFGAFSFVVGIYFLYKSIYLYRKSEAKNYFSFFFLLLSYISLSPLLIFLNKYNLFSSILPANFSGSIAYFITYKYQLQSDFNMVLLASFLGFNFLFLLFCGFDFYKMQLNFIKFLIFKILSIVKVKKIHEFGTAYTPAKSSLDLSTLDNFSYPESVIMSSKNSATQNASINQVSNVKDLSLVHNERYKIMPNLSLLDDSQLGEAKYMSDTEIRKNSQKLMQVLNDFGINGQIINVTQGPVVTLYELEPVPGIKSSRIIGLADDIARSLSVASARISVIPNKNALGIELPNKVRMFFKQKELLDSQEFRSKKFILPLVLGKNLIGKPFVVDLAQMPHLLIAGTTGSGKSVAINTMILSLLYKYSQEECKMIMIDPKMLELSAYIDIPHLLTPVVTEASKAVLALKWAVKEMENRYKLISHLGVRNIMNFNQKILEAKKNNQSLTKTIQTGFDSITGLPKYEKIEIVLKTMPFIVVIVDEMADLMLASGKEVEASIQRLAQMARASGIHIIMATQRPSVDVITGVIKANFPSRISFKVTSKIDSRTILGEQGAEQLLGKGDMLYMGNGSEIFRVHGAFVGDEEIANVTNFLRSQARAEYFHEITEQKNDSQEDQKLDHKMLDKECSLYTRAYDIVKKEKKSSISYIQRSLRIGYNKAANIVDELEKNGILSPPNSLGKREILIKD